MHWDVIVVGAGAAGLMAASRAAERGRRTLLLEKNRKPGVKILMSGGTRCNLTHATDRYGIVEAFGPAGRFLHSALSALGPDDLIDLFEQEGVATKVEATGKVFPVSNKAMDVLDALLRRLQRTGCTLALAEPLLQIERIEEKFRLRTSLRTLTTDKLLLTTGGKSYPGCGTTGDGYDWATQLGHSVIAPRPALVPVRVAEDWVAELKGVTIPDVRVRVIGKSGGKTLIERRGSFLFTHFGLSGPVVLDVSRVITEQSRPSDGFLECDFLPEMTEPQLDALLRERSLAEGKKRLAGVLPGQLPRRLAELMLQRAALSPDRQAAGLAKSDRQKLVQSMKRMSIPVHGTLGFEKAEVTAGGVDLAEVDSRSMQSKKLPNLYLAGELLDLDGPIGGYNFQAAFSTSWLAGESV